MLLDSNIINLWPDAVDTQYRGFSVDPDLQLLDPLLAG